MDLHWWCCECNTTNSSPDDDHLVCSQEGCDHHLCSDCYNPQQIGQDRHLNYNQASTTRTTISRAIVSDSRYDELRMKKEYLKAARRLIGYHMKHSRIGRSFLNFWSHVLRKSGRKKEKLRIEAKKGPTIVIASNTESVGSTSHYYEPEETTHYSEEKYYYQR